MLVHASSIAINNTAILITGPAGIGKSDLALRMIDEGAELIADDQTFLEKEGELLIASAPAPIAGIIEVRHVGILHVPHTLSAIVALYIELAPPGEILERLPEKQFITFANVKIRRIRLPAFATSTPAKIRAALKYRDTE